MAMKKVRTHFEVRTPRYHQGEEAPEAHVKPTLAQAQAYALTRALGGKSNGYTGVVHVVEVETHESVLSSYDAESAVAILSDLPSDA